MCFVVKNLLYERNVIMALLFGSLNGNKLEELFSMQIDS